MALCGTRSRCYAREVETKTLVSDSSAVLQTLLAGNVGDRWPTERFEMQALVLCGRCSLLHKRYRCCFAKRSVLFDIEAQSIDLLMNGVCLDC